MDLSDIKSRIFKDEDGWNNYRNVSIEEMDWLVEQVEKFEEFKVKYKQFQEKWNECNEQQNNNLFFNGYKPKGFFNLD